MCRMAPGGGPCPAHPVLSGKARPQWPEVAEHPSHPLLGVLGWEHPARAGHGRHSPADPSLLPPLQPPQVPSQPRVTPWEQEECLSLPIYHPSASTALPPCLSRYLPLSGLPAAPISPLLVSILIKMSHFAGMALPGQGRPGLLEPLPIRVLRHFSKQFTRMLGKQRVLKSTKQPARSSDPSQGAAPCAANASAHGDPEPATAFLQGRTQPGAGDSLAQDTEASDMCRNRNEHVPA